MCCNGYLTTADKSANASALASGRMVAAMLHVLRAATGLACVGVAVLSAGGAPPAGQHSGSGKRCRRPAAPEQCLSCCYTRTKP